jgi:hypothetical protein
MERKPVDGVMCVVWLSKQPYPKVAELRGEYWTCPDTGQQFHVSRTTHWTTLDEAKAAPELVEVSRAAMEHLCQDPSPTCCESAACRIAIGDALAKIGDTHATH